MARLVVGVNDLQTANPVIAAQWHPTKNGLLTPEQVTSGSSIKVWWKCVLAGMAHEWEAKISERAIQRTGCPVCSGNTVLAGCNDLKTVNPALAAQWHPTKNGLLGPEQVTVGSSKRVWWLCEVNPKHEWEATITNRTQGSGCLICSGRAVLAGCNDLETVHPAIAAQWHPTKNGVLTPNQVAAGTERRVWWFCEVNPKHEWEARISSRARKGSGCPICSGKAVLAGCNDLETVAPEIAAQWHPTRNGLLTPKQVTIGSSKKVWWKCIASGVAHEWEAEIRSRTRKGYGCPICSGRTALAGFNDLGTVNPAIAAQWHPTRNGLLTPKQVTVATDKRVWWLCTESEGVVHEWEATICSRTVNGNGCPICAGRIVLAGYNDLGTLYPEIAAQWHPTKNGSLVPEQVTAGMPKKIWWQCTTSDDVLHEWEATIGNRTIGGHNCPICSGHIVLTGYNDLGTLYPEIAAQWHPTKNGLLSPVQVTSGSSKRVWWRCEINPKHEWEAAVANRARNGTGCSQCASGKTERLFRESFRKATGYNFEMRYIPMMRSSRKRQIAQIDMISDELLLVIEYDGAWTHGDNVLFKHTLEQKLADDKETTEALVQNGYNVIRIRNHDAVQKLPFVLLDPQCETNVFQITYKSFGKDRDTIDEIVARVINEKKDWFNRVSPS